MADVRSMLRAERANRRIAHPNASYTSDGKLLCNLCQVSVRNEAAWSGHLHSTQHTLRSSRAQDAAAIRSDAGSKKRKAEGSDAPGSPEGIKRARAAPVLLAGADAELPLEERASVETDGGENVDSRHSAQLAQTTISVPSEPTTARPDVIDDELAAFERELAALESTSDPPISAINAEATVAAAPMSAAEVAAQAREEQSAQRGRRDEEIAAEKEDAAVALENEFEEMEGLEERVRRLRERREALRRGAVSYAKDAESGAVEAQVFHGIISAGDEGRDDSVADDEDEDDEDEDEDDDYFRSR